MKNRIVGMIILVLTVVIGLIIYLFNRALAQIVSTSCTHGTNCPMWGTLNFQTNISLGIMALIALVGLYLILFSEWETTKDKIKTEQKEISKEAYQEMIKGLDATEKEIIAKVIEGKGAIFQSDLVENTGLSKVKVTRILDKLEGRGLIERKRRGMTNVVILKH